MRIVKIIVGILAVAFGVFALYNATLDKEYSVSRSNTINADAEIVRALVSDFSTWPEWSAWFSADSTMNYTLGEPFSGVGATYSWTSENSGSGAMEILSLTNESMDTRIEFVGQGTSHGHWDFTPLESGQTQVTWGFNGEMPFFMRWMGAQMDQWVGPDFETGLSNLAALAEAEAIAQEVAEQMTMQPIESTEDIVL